tara:strand:- start:379 stop:576 length:198 start_codon:yes stop_codon:yes gene_type:complete
MEKLKIKQELIDLIMKLSDLDFQKFCSNYRIENAGRSLLRFIEDLDEDTIEEVINEIHINTETDY